MATIELLQNLAKDLEIPQLKRARREWGGADVVITQQMPENLGGGFYPDPRYVITEYALELSWLFVALRDIFYAESLLDSCSKIEFFGRLANAANRFISKNIQVTANTLCAAVLHEAFAIYEEMSSGEFRCFAVAFGNEIVDDYIDALHGRNDSPPKSTPPLPPNKKRGSSLTKRSASLKKR